MDFMAHKMLVLSTPFSCVPFLKNVWVRKTAEETERCALSYSGRVDQHQSPAGKLDRCVDRVVSRARDWAHYGPLLSCVARIRHTSCMRDSSRAYDPVQKTRFAHIRPPDDGDFHAFRLLFLFLVLI
jgi:hypothetical protein